jgi:putative transcriptional regulator
MKFPRKTSLQDDGGAIARNEADVPRSESTASARSTKSKPQARKTSKRGYLDGQMLIAMPSMGDDRFARSVIYVCAHSTEGAMGIIVNQPASHISFADLLVQLEVVPAAELIRLPGRAGGVTVLKGGPVDTQRGFVLHSSDFFIENSTLPIDEGIRSRARLCRLGARPAGDRDPA